MTIFPFVSYHVRTSTVSSLPNFHQFFVHSLETSFQPLDKDLTNRFEFSQASESRYFKMNIDITLLQLQPVGRWLGLEELRSTLPAVFRKQFKKCVAIYMLFPLCIYNSSCVCAICMHGYTFMSLLICIALKYITIMR